MKKESVVVISGVTASGKSFLALELAKKINGVILNADAMQIYKGLPILSAQPSEEDKEIVEHRLYGIFEPTESNSVFKWLNIIKENIDDIIKQGKTPIIVGGSGMYISRLINGIRELPDTDEELRNDLNKLYNEIGWDAFFDMVKKIDEESVAKLKKNDKHRLIKIYEVFKTSGKKISEWEKLPNVDVLNSNDIIHINLSPDRDILYKRCEDRFNIMAKDVVEEVKNFSKIYDIFNGKKYSILNTIGLLEIKAFIDGEMTFENAVAKSIKKTKNYAKQQYTWFRNQFKSFDFLLTEVPNRININETIRSITQ